MRKLVLLAGLLAVGGTSLRAWQVDVHYLLTFWLATQAGFSRDAADDIAGGNQSLDESDYDAAISTMVWVLVRGDEGAAQAVRDNHFPSDGPIPSPPARRAVVANGPLARGPVVALIRPDPSSTALDTLGRGLHPFHDSWSHQGVPDVPLRPLRALRPGLSSAHPRARGGWRSEDADLTHLHVEEVVDLARETYLLLRQYLDQNPRRRIQPAADWAALEATVREFAQARTKDEKDAWMATHIPLPPGAAAGISGRLTLPGGPTGGVTRQFRALEPPPDLVRPGEIAPALVDAANAFANAWIANRNIGGAGEFVDVAGLADLFAGTPGPLGDRVPAALTEWSRKFLVMYLATDHAQVNAAGHADPGHPLYDTLPETAQTDGPFRAAGGLERPTFSAGHFAALDDNPLAPGFAVALRLSDVPHEAIVLVWRQTGGRWAITAMFPVVG